MAKKPPSAAEQKQTYALRDACRKHALGLVNDSALTRRGGLVDAQGLTLPQKPLVWTIDEESGLVGTIDKTKALVVVYLKTEPLRLRMSRPGSCCDSDGFMHLLNLQVSYQVALNKPQIMPSVTRGRMAWHNNDDIFPRWEGPFPGLVRAWEDLVDAAFTGPLTDEDLYERDWYDR